MPLMVRTQNPAAEAQRGSPPMPPIGITTPDDDEKTEQA